MSFSSLIGEKIGSDGSVVGVVIGGNLFIVAAAGVVLQDSAGVWWQLTVGTDGSLVTSPVQGVPS